MLVHLDVAVSETHCEIVHAYTLELESLWWGLVCLLVCAPLRYSACMVGAIAVLLLVVVHTYLGQQVMNIFTGEWCRPCVSVGERFHQVGDSMQVRFARQYTGWCVRHLFNLMYKVPGEAVPVYLLEYEVCLVRQ